jgi:general secretion pathway protein I
MSTGYWLLATRTANRNSLSLWERAGVRARNLPQTSSFPRATQDPRQSPSPHPNPLPKGEGTGSRCHRVTVSPRLPFSPSPCRAFSLFEVILALTILTGAIAVLGELSRQGMEATRMARAATYAQLLCESKLNEIVAGIELPESVQGAPCEDVMDPTQTYPWVYSVEVASTEEQGLIAVTVTVRQDMPEQLRPVACTLVRWMLDPNVDFSSETDTSTSSSSSSSSSSGQPTSGSSSSSTNGGTR